MLPDDADSTRRLRLAIFPTLYAVFQRTQGATGPHLKIKNRTLRSLLKSCLYAKCDLQLTRTKSDAEALLEKVLGRDDV